MNVNISVLFGVVLIGICALYFFPFSQGVFFLSSHLPWRAYFYLVFHPKTTLSLYNQSNEREQEIIAERHRVVSLSDENTILRSALRFGKEKKKQLVFAEVIGYNTDPILKAFIIDHGKKEGVKEGMPVVNEEGFLLGKIDRIEDERAFVKQIQSPDMEFLVHIEGQKVANDFIARGVVNYVLGTKIQKGDYVSNVLIVTSGVDGKFPSGLLVGEAQAFVLSKDHTFMETVITTSNEPKKNVFIITNITQ